MDPTDGFDEFGEFLGGILSGGKRVDRYGDESHVVQDLCCARAHVELWGGVYEADLGVDEWAVELEGVGG